MDAEIVATDPTDGALKTFQDLSHRTRKDVRLDKVSVAVTVFAFDLMEINGKECTVHPLLAQLEI
jgi:DNA ligase-1